MMTQLLSHLCLVIIPRESRVTLDFEDRCYPIHFEQDDYSSIWTVSNREEEKPYVGIRSDPIQLSDNGEYPQHYGMPTQWYDGPLVVERGDEEVREETG